MPRIRAMTADLDPIRARHWTHELTGLCMGCGKIWPCDIAALLARIDELTAENERLRSWITDLDPEASFD